MNDRANWLARRRLGIGGSDAPGVIGVAPPSWNLTPLSIYMEKRGELPETKANLPMEWGELLEAPILTMFQRRSGKNVVVGESIRNMVRPGHPFMRVNLDGLIPDEKRIVEAKLASSDERWGEPGSDQVPIYFGVQAQHEMAVAEMEVVEFAVLFCRFGLRELQTYEVPRDDELIEMLTEREATFWQRVVDGNPPDPTTPEDIRLRWPTDTGREIEATEDIAQAWGELLAVKSTLKHAESREEELKAAIQGYMTDASVLTYAGKTIATWKQSKDSLVLDKDRLALGHPEIVREYSKLKAGNRPLLVKQ